MHPRVLQIAGAVVAKASRETPADAALRLALKREQGLPPELSREVAQAVFSYYRWLGWLEAGQSIADRMSHALELATTFVRNPTAFSDDELVARAVPAWIGEELTVSSAWVRVLQAEPRLWLRAKVGQGRMLAEALGDCWISDEAGVADAVEYRGSHDLFRTPEFHAGDFELQDLNSQVVGLACAPKPGETWWDACAGEGGKLLHLSGLMQNKGLIWASDRASWRLQRLKQRAGRAKVFNYRSVPWNDPDRLPTRTKFDGVLVDAPCSGVGTWQRNPHARWTMSAEDVKELAALQRRLLTQVAPAVKTGGRLFYSVCTLTRAETQGVATDFEKDCPGFRRLPLVDPFEAEAPAVGTLELWPQDHGGNGMFIAAWERLP